MAKVATKAKKGNVVVKKPKKAAALKTVAAPEILKLDLGCGQNKLPGFLGVDALALTGVDVITDLRKPWPWADGSVDEVHSSHFVEHLDRIERVHFWNELGRVLRVGAQARIITPHWSNACAYGDPTHQWPPMTEWAIYYLSKAWRAINAPHVDVEGAPVRLTCDFDHVIGGTWTPELESRNQETKIFWMTHYINSYRDLIVTLTKRGP